MPRKTTRNRIPSKALESTGSNRISKSETQPVVRETQGERRVSNYRQKIKPGLKRLQQIMSELNESNNDLAHSIYYDLYEVEDLFLYPFQTVPKKRFIHVTSRMRDHKGNFHKSYYDIVAEFEREISAAKLYIALQIYVRHYKEGYYLQASLQTIEKWLNEQKALYKTVKEADSCLIEDTSLTIGNFKTDYGSIDFFIEYGIDFEG